MLYFFYFIAFCLFFLLIFFILDIIIIPKEKTPLLGAIGIIISAFIASFSVKASINNTNKIENINKERKIKSLRLQLALIVTKINDNENDVLSLNEKNTNDSIQLTFYFYKKLTKYLSNIGELLLKNNYSEYIDDEENYLLLSDIIGIIHNLNYYYEILNDIESFGDNNLHTNITKKINELKLACEKLLKSYKK